MSFDIQQLIVELDTDWKGVLSDVAIPHNKFINENINIEISKFNDMLDILPPRNMILDAFNHFDVNDLKVVILGQDVYPTKGDGIGLCFSVSKTTRCPPSLRNIFKELEAEYGVKRNNVDLIDWANQGVLMLNTALTVREGCAGSHIKIWKKFTEDIIHNIANNHKNIVYLLWGNHAISYSTFIDSENNCILTHSHPSPLARKSFIGNNHFKLCNDYLNKIGKDQIKWV